MDEDEDVELNEEVVDELELALELDEALVQAAVWKEPE